MKYDLIDLPGESSEPTPDCTNCFDSGMVQVGDRGEDFCTCATGHQMADDFYNQEPELDDFADADALASCGWGSDEDYGCY